MSVTFAAIETPMRAAVVTAPGEVVIQLVPRPVPGPDEVVFRVEGCGVCASNLGPWAGPEWMRFPTPPGDLGHEAWGMIDAVGPGVADLKPGDRIAALSTRAYAEFDVAHADNVVLLPPDFAGRPFPAEPLACAMNIFRRSGIAAGMTVAIIGIGFLGALLTRLAADAGARVIAISRRASSLDLARANGAAETIAMEDHAAIVEQVRQSTGGAGCPVVIEAVGKQWPLDLAGEITAERGRLVIAGFHQDGPRQVSMGQWNWKGIDVVNAHERDPAVYRQGMLAAIAAVEDGRVDPFVLVTHTFPLERLAEALNLTRDKPEGFVKAVVVP